MAIDPAILRNELDALTREVGRLMRNTGGHRAGPDGQPIAEPTAAAIGSLSAGLRDADFHIERLIQARPIMAAAAAFAVGVAVGLLLRRT
ncbi:hypothetical protein SSBR45G_23750 [Bradyrhizobium sp. SSBR45G]|nr:hypothetical protein SSBR45G_23750 [Bradyrhizobium sp. SSBR45G]GLH84427.1 hypothetical protein SSBR45R_18870 [Bradyrhizobium sp. SSBR45R]